jgi:EmrB/QacA subfamily drug resistance transporter
MTEPARALDPGDVRLIIICAMATIFLSVLDQTIVATSLPSIAADLGNFSLISWVITSYLLTSTCVTPIIGKISDLYGRRLVLNVCLITFVAGSALCAIAPSMILLILARMVQGLGGGGLLTLAQTMIADVVSPRERGRYAAFLSITWGLAAVAGPTLGGLLTEYYGWAMIFWINLPLGLGALLLANRVLGKLPSVRRKSKIDFVSILLLCGATVALLLVLSLGGARLPWASPSLLSLLGAAIGFGALFVWKQMRSAEPIIPPHFVKDRVVRPVLVLTFVIQGSFLAIVTLMPIFFQVAQRVSAGRSGVLMLPLVFGITIISYFSATYIRRTGRYKPPPMIGLPVAVAVTVLIAFLATRVSGPVIALILGAYGGAVGYSMPSCNVAAQNAVAPRDLGAVTGAVGFIRILGGAVGLAAASALVLGVAANALPQSGVTFDIETLTRQVLTPEERHAVAGAFSVLFGALAGFLLIGLAVFSRIEERELSRTIRTAADQPVE